nr:MAG TPA: distal tail protein [Caudoviricetes sp.]
MTISVTYNGQSISDLVDEITNITRNIGTSYSNTYADQGASRNGQPFLYATRGVKPISVEFKVTGNLQKLHAIGDKIINIYDNAKPAPLEFGDEPNKVWYAVPSGSPTYSISQATSPPEATGTISFDVPTSVAEAKSYTVLKNANPTEQNGSITKISDSTYKVIINNQGTAETFPIIRVKHRKENGYIGIVTKDDIFAMGSEEEVDTQPYKRSEILWDYVSNGWITKAFSDGKKNVATLNDTSQNLNGTLGLVDAWGRQHIALSNRGSGPRPNNAASLTWDIPADSAGEKGALNEYLWWRQIFWLGATNQFGFIKLAVTAEDGSFLYGVETIKRSNGLVTEYNFLASNGRGGFNSFNLGTFWGTHNSNENPFNAESGWCDLIRRDDSVMVHWWGTHPQYNIPEIKGKKSAKVHVALGAFGDRPLVSHMYLDSIVYRKDFVAGIEDVPNRYAANSNVEIDMGSGHISVNGISSNNEEIDGSDFFTIPKGKSELEIHFSSWIKELPDVEIVWKERYA